MARGSILSYCIYYDSSSKVLTWNHFVLKFCPLEKRTKFRPEIQAYFLGRNNSSLNTISSSRCIGPFRVKISWCHFFKWQIFDLTTPNVQCGSVGVVVLSAFKKDPALKQCCCSPCSPSSLPHESVVPSLFVRNQISHTFEARYYSY